MINLKTAASVENELPGFFFVINLQICTNNIFKCYFDFVFFLILTRILNALITAYLRGYVDLILDEIFFNKFQ